MSQCTADDNTCAILGQIKLLVINPILTILTAVAVMLFVYGLVEYMLALRSGKSSGDAGRDHMFYGLVGLFIIITSMALLTVMSNTVHGLFGG